MGFVNIVFPLSYSKNPLRLFLMVIPAIIVELGLIITLIVLYGNAIIHFYVVNIDMLRYAFENNCTDGPMLRSIAFILNGFSRDTVILRAALGLIVISLIL